MSLGAWQLGLKDLGLGGNGDYGLDTILVSNTVTRITTSVDGALIAAINDTDYYQGFIGVGVTQGRFGTKVVNPYITQLAESYGTIPSHSYGYTAGAYYGECNLDPYMPLLVADPSSWERRPRVADIGRIRLPAILAA